MSTPTRILLVGAAGRMGQAIQHAADGNDAFEIVGRLERGEAVCSSLNDCDGVIDFSHADATSDVCAAAIRAKKPLVIGTTGHTFAQLAAIKSAAEKIPVLLAANFSVGVNTLFWLTRKAAELLGPEVDLEVVETHHRLKKDAPSGTAKRLAEILCEARQLSYEKDVAHGRQGMIGERPDTQIGMHSIRAGDVVGEHTVILAGKGERLELTHKAASRETFAAGALRAAQWLVGKPAGLYDMEDVLHLK
ncbi:MAG: 4-hydroxy-tetrahydrodipicolinate reductase [Chthoniobacterales bacterium]